MLQMSQKTIRVVSMLLSDQKQPIKAVIQKINRHIKWNQLIKSNNAIIQDTECSLSRGSIKQI